jgi:hypothetical protein
MKNHGLSLMTHTRAQQLLLKLPDNSVFRQRMTSWLLAQSASHAALGLGDQPMPVSSDILESLFGKFKAAIARNPKAEFNRIILAIPTLCGTVNHQVVEQALNNVSHRDLENWQHQNVGVSQWQARQAFHHGKLTPDMVPKPGEKFWEKAA